MFSVDARENLRSVLIEKARSDPRVIAAAAVGGSAVAGDRWSDLDLSFGVADDVSVQSVLDDWTEAVTHEFGGTVLFDLAVQSSIYRVFLLPGKLQVDLSFTPAGTFGAIGPRFELIFGEAVEREFPTSPAAHHTFGIAVHHAVRAHISIERGRLWQAEYWIHALRDEVMVLACSRFGLEMSHGRGFDRLPPDVLHSLEGAVVSRVTVDELRRALAVATSVLVREGEHNPGVARWLRLELEELCRLPVPD